MSTALTMSAISACLSFLMLISYLGTDHARWRMRLSLTFGIVALLAAMFDVGIIKAYNPPAPPIHYAPWYSMR